MSDAFTPPTQNRSLHLCGNYRHLLQAVADLVADNQPGTIVYLEDYLPVSGALREKLRVACPLIEFIYTTDANEMRAFQNLPRFLPAILQRNLRLGGKSGVQAPTSWAGPLIGTRRFGTGYVYNSGFFLAKVVAGRCDRVVLRESGLENYVRFPVHGLKRLIRALWGLPPRHQVYGEERWIERIEVARPEALPAEVRKKGFRFTLAEVLGKLPPLQAGLISSAFLDADPITLDQDKPSAILLTQPLDLVSICQSADKHRIYSGIIDDLQSSGYRVYVKHHPRDTNISPTAAIAIPATFPMEAWPYFSHQRFDVAVALCSASIASESSSFADRAIQLLDPDEFNAAAFAGWPDKITASLLRVGQVS